MTDLRLGDQLIQYDRNATVAAYSNVESGSAQRCGCDVCRNFLAQPELYPQDFLSLLDQLGIDQKKEADLHAFGPLANNIQPTAGWFYFAGELIVAGEGIAKMGKNLQCFVRGAGTTSVTKLFGPNVCTLEFNTRVPWVLQEYPEY
jgi:hypothetical protein